MRTARKSFNSYYMQTVENFGSKFILSGKGLDSTKVSAFPRLTHTSHMNRSSSLSFRNTKNKLQQLEDDLKDIRDQLIILGCQTKTTKQNLQSTQQEFINRQLPNIQSTLSQEIRKVAKSIKIGQISNISRNDLIKSDIMEIATSSKSIKHMLNEIGERISRIEDTMGFYNGREKHKY